MWWPPVPKKGVVSGDRSLINAMRLFLELRNKRILEGDRPLPISPKTQEYSVSS